MKYVSKYTYFCANDEPLTDKIYCKYGNKTTCIIHVNEDWNMTGEVIDPFNLYISPLKPIYRDLTQEECERMLLKDTPQPNRKDIIEKYGVNGVIDYAKFMYSTRLINMINTYWLAWSENDKAEDYHPLYNKDILKERDSSSIVIDPEPEDLEPKEPYWQPDIKNTIDYVELSIPDGVTFGS